MKLLLSLCAVFLSACTSVLPAGPSLPAPADVASVGEIVDLRSGARLSAAELLTRLAAAPRVLVGEQHDQAEHHRIELWLAQQLARQRPQGSVLLEMLNPDQQDKVDQVKLWLQGNPVVRAERVAELLSWQKGWSWALYGDLAMDLMRAPYPLLSANLDRAEVQTIGRQQPALSGALSTRPEVRARLEATIRDMHDNQIDAPRLQAMLSVQQQRDRRMAERLLAAPAPALLMAGGYHAAKDIGVPLHVRDLAGEQPLTVLMLAERGADVSLQQADYVWYTPAQPEPAI
ncbi:ChaN family lipoprotein [Janthinobacterium fluminis]|uniref:ChaN family lipoprotein n=1 Tax=Janthinobacterium fluminis TaxID=2987524 RepID=A0ABT5K2T3_9BURK|nr:ChaN family lipoprotein [Janthinobacterium fluminis]MDC8759214.1 ChaN family lipoprotein [Janthinobacterium fluminis]